MAIVRFDKGEAKLSREKEQKQPARADVITAT